MVTTQTPLVDIEQYLPDGQLTVFYDREQERYVYMRVRTMKYDDALVCYEHGGWRLEYICPPKGFVRYALYTTNNKLVGIQYVRAASWLPVVQRYLAAYLTVIGFTAHNTQLKSGGAKTPWNAPTNRLPKLFHIPGEELFDVEARDSEGRVEDDVEAEPEDEPVFDEESEAS